MPKYLHANPEEILFEEGEEKNIIQILRPIKAEHAFFGDFDIDMKMLKQFVENFNNKVISNDIPVNYSHDRGGKAAGWIKELFIKGRKLLAEVEWTEPARAAIENKEFRYISAEFNEKYKDVESGEEYGAVLLGAALTNIPFVKGMNKVLSEEQNFSYEDFVAFMKSQKPKKEVNMLDELIKQLSEASEADKKKVAEAIGATFDSGEDKGNKELSEAQDQVKTLSEENAKLKKEIEFSEMLEKGEVHAGQKDAFINENFKEFAEKAVPTNMKAKGNGEKPEEKALDDGEPKTPAEAEDKILELAQEKLKKNKEAGKSITLSDAISEVLGENPKLSKLRQG